MNKTNSHLYALIICVAACSTLTGCAVFSIADAAVSTAATVVSTAVSVTGSVVKGAVNAVTP
jgi:hypothetical protein